MMLSVPVFGPRGNSQSACAFNELCALGGGREGEAQA